MSIPDPEFEAVQVRDRGIMQSDHRAGIVLTGTRRQHAVRQFHLRWDKATKAEADELVAQWNTSKGTTLSFSYAPTEFFEPATTVKFANGQDMEVEWLAHDRYRMSCVLEEKPPLTVP
jgi:hypothetical protein